MAEVPKVITITIETPDGRLPPAKVTIPDPPKDSKGLEDFPSKTLNGGH